MAATIPSSVPVRLTAGETWRWEISLSDYPANDGWTLSYSLVRETTTPGNPVNITASASGALHSVTVAAATTAGYTAGRYRYRAYVSHATTGRYMVEEGQIQVDPDFATNSQTDPRSHAQKTLDALESVIAGKASADTASYTVMGVQISKLSPKQLLEWRDFYRAEVAREREALAARRGTLPNRNIGMRFTVPS